MNRRSFLATLAAALALPAVAMKALGKKPAPLPDVVDVPDLIFTDEPTYWRLKNGSTIHGLTCPVPGCNGDMRKIKHIGEVAGHYGPHIFKMASSSQEYMMLYGDTGAVGYVFEESVDLL